MAETKPDVLAVLRKLERMPSLVINKDGDSITRFETSEARAAVAELIARDTEYDAALEALADLNRNIAERGWIDLEHDALRKACERVSRAKIDRAVALRNVQGGAA